MGPIPMGPRVEKSTFWAQKVDNFDSEWHIFNILGSRILKIGAISAIYYNLEGSNGIKSSRAGVPTHVYMYASVRTCARTYKCWSKFCMPKNGARSKGITREENFWTPFFNNYDEKCVKFCTNLIIFRIICEKEGRIFLQIHTFAYACAYTCSRVRSRVCMHTHVRSRTRARTCTRAYARINK